MASEKKPSLPVPDDVWRNPIFFIAFGFGSGAIAVAPGTFGTLLAIPFFILLSALSPIYYFIFVCIFCIFSIWVCDYVSKRINVHDHPGMCLDEFAGFFVTMIAVPVGFTWIVLGFVLFRFFDIVKPFPIRYIDEHVHGGFGMVFDDIVAGAVSCGIIQIVLLITRHI